MFLLQREIDRRDDERLTKLPKAAGLKVTDACIEDINWRASRGLDFPLITKLAGCVGVIFFRVSALGHNNRLA